MTTDFRRVLTVRSTVLHAIRAFFLERGFLEVETPVRVRTPALELHIDAEPAGEAFLRTSPELHMKRLLAAGFERIFQIGPCFRRGERGRLHHPEYTMLEWYRTGAGYEEVLADTRELLRAAARAVHGNTTVPCGDGELDLAAAGVDCTIREAYLAHAGWDPVADWDADRFDHDLVTLVEPALPREVPVVLRDYPAAAAALARLKPGRPDVAERWELYAGGLELANAYSELTDPDVQAERFRTWAEQRSAQGRAVYPPDEAFLASLRAGLPEAGGVALGVDRLVMLLANVPSLDEVLPFREG